MNYDSLHFLPAKLPHPKSDFAVFIDRDGVVWEEREPGVPFTDYALYPQVTTAIKKLNEKGIFTVIINNQARVARGLVTDQEAIQSNVELANKLKAGGAYIDLMLYCPHSEFADVAKYKINCTWRKPGSGMLSFVEHNLPIDLKKSFVIGDQARDFLAGKQVGAKAIGVKTGKAGQDDVFQGEPDIWKKGLPDAVDFILNSSLQQ